jgi:uncharacterized protein (TIGR00299 family) protein
MKILYFDCFSGVAGDMVLGSLMDLGMDFAAWKEDLGTLPIQGEFDVELRSVKSGPIAGSRVEVTVHADPAPGHRRLEEVMAIVEASRLPPPVKARSGAVFRRLAEAEAKVHGVSLETVALHEVGGVDAIVDVTGAALAIHRLGVDAVCCSPLTLGRTRVKTAHGELPTPAPATLELVKGAPVEWCQEAAELTTPTGAALVTTWSGSFGPAPAGTVIGVGYGAGTLDLPGRVNALRAILLETRAAAGADRVAVIETNLDDMSPEHVGAVVPELLDAGALDAFTSAVTMKKGRPGLRLTVLAPLDLKAAIVARVLRETTTLGVRIHEVERTVLGREHATVETDWGPVRVKLGLLGEEVVKVAPEHEDCARVARRAGVPLVEVYRRALAAYYGART